MDERTLDWLHWMPVLSRFVVRGAPATFTDLISSRASPYGTSLIAWQIGPRELETLGAFESVALLNPRGIQALSLKRHGFAEVLSFRVLPSLDEARWYIPPRPTRVAAQSFDLYSPVRRRAQAKKRAVQAMARIGLLDRVGDTLLLGRRTKSDFELWLQESVATPSLSMAMSTGSLQRHRKPVIRVANSDGEVLGYAKLAASVLARQALYREAYWLQNLAPGRLAGMVPSLIASYKSPGTASSLQTPGPGGVPPQDYTASHHRFLSILASETQRPMPFRASIMWRDIQDELATIVDRLDTGRREPLMRAARRLEDGLGDVDVLMGVAHRDFAPQNHRLHLDGRLYTFDWELAKPEFVPLYDFFHFRLVRRVAHSGQQQPTDCAESVCAAAARWSPEYSPRMIRYFFLAYVIERYLTRFWHIEWKFGGRSDALFATLERLIDASDAWVSVA